MAQPDVVQVTVCEEDQEAVLALLTETVTEALSDVTAMRDREGAALAEDLTFHLNEVARLRDEIAVLAPKVPLIYQEKLQARIRELGVQEIDPQRLAQEVALMADRCAIDEELARLDSHIGTMSHYLEQSGEMGKKMASE